MNTRFAPVLDNLSFSTLLRETFTRGFRKYDSNLTYFSKPDSKVNTFVFRNAKGMIRLRHLLVSLSNFVCLLLPKVECTN